MQTCIRLNWLWCGPHWYPVSPRSVPLLLWCLVSLVSGVWSLVSGVWSLVSGLWCLVSGVWSLVSGLWCLVSGVSGGLAVRLGLRFSSGSSSPRTSPFGASLHPRNRAATRLSPTRSPVGAAKMMTSEGETAAFGLCGCGGPSGATSVARPYRPPGRPCRPAGSRSGRL